MGTKEEPLRKVVRPGFAWGEKHVGGKSGKVAIPRPVLSLNLGYKGGHKM